MARRFSSRRGIRSTTPPATAGSYWAQSTGAAADRYPTTGRGDISATVGDALWSSLTAGTFDVVIEGIHLASNTTSVAITELHADGKFLLMESEADNGNKGMDSMRIPLRDGFKVTWAGDGGFLTFRIQQYFE
jgi:hypothetical protein